MCIAYDGTRYSGWQIQPNSLSIQEILEKACSLLLKVPIRIVGAGRTDAGVHASGQVAHFCTHIQIDERRVSYALNGMLPKDIRIKELYLVSDNFHAQYSALSKEYHYHLWLDKTLDPFYYLYRYHFFNSQFSLSLLQEASSYLLGTHDFATFTNSGSSILNTVRTIKRIDLTVQEGGVRLEFEGNGFLYKMIRNLVGTLLEIAVGKRNSKELVLLLEAKDRRQAGPAAPASGLFLKQVNYPSCFEIHSGKE